MDDRESPNNVFVATMTMLHLSNLHADKLVDSQTGVDWTRAQIWGQE